MTTTVSVEKLRTLLLRIQSVAAAIQGSDQHDKAFVLGWRGATNTYAVHLQELIRAAIHERADIIAALAGAPPNTASTQTDSGEPQPLPETVACIVCGQPTVSERNPLRCLVCELDTTLGPPPSAAALAAFAHGLTEQCALAGCPDCVAMLGPQEQCPSCGRLASLTATRDDGADCCVPCAEREYERASR